MREVNILFLAGAKRVSLAEEFIKSGKKLRLNVNVFSYELSKEVPIYFVAKEIIIGKRWDDKRIGKHLIEVIKQKKIDIILPFVDPATVILSKIKNQINSSVFNPISDLTKVEVFFDKLASNRWCIDNNIAVPYYRPKTFPLIAKPRFGSASKGISIINNEEEYNKVDDSKYLVQRFIFGKEYTVDCYVSTKGDVISISPRIRLETQGGESVKSITDKNIEIIQASKGILDKAKLVGPITIQFLQENDTGNIYFMELNPRFGGAVLTSIGAGANIPTYLLKDYLGESLKYNEDWEDKVLMIRRFNEYYIRCK